MDKIQKIKAKIGKLKIEYNKESVFRTVRGDTAEEVLDKILSFIDSLSEEHVSEDLEEELHSWMRENCDDNGFFNQLELARHFAEWQRKKDQETIELAEDHAMLAGMEKMREEMMKNTVLETKVMKDSDGDGIETPYDEWLTLESTEILSLSDNLGLKDGDKVKIIIVKEE